MVKYCRVALSLCTSLSGLGLCHGWSVPLSLQKKAIVTPSLNARYETGKTSTSLFAIDESLDSLQSKLFSGETDASANLFKQLGEISIDNDTIEKITSAVKSLFDNVPLATPGGSPLSFFSSIMDGIDSIDFLKDIAEQLNQNSNIAQILEQLRDNLPMLDDVPDSALLVVSSVITYTVVSSALSLGQGPPPSRPYPLGKYDPISARAYFDSRLPQVVSRAVEIALKSSGFALKIAQDYLSNNLKEKSEQRALELAELLTDLGPTFIKVGQSLSIRTDILSPAYVRGLKSLQDQVAAFPTIKAKEILEDELGVPVEEVFSEFSNEPVAAASLGQVYKAKLKSNGKDVAVKIQRPDIMTQIALDMHLLREFAPWAKNTFNLNTDTTGTVDAWGRGFVDELDYIAEAENGEYFTTSIQSTPLSGVVFSPPIVEECTTGRVLTTEWVIGERLDRSSTEDVTALCSIAMNTYLTMMLETGVLHCDPHPGNLLRTPDGRLCILDWGMVTTLNPDLQSTLIEHMAHLTSADYDEIPRDLLLLGFIPENKADLIQDSGIVEVLADIYGAWTSGGGVGAINVNKVVSQLQDLTEKKGNLFQIPPYFAYIAKSFSVLEGIGLSNDEKYSIINECLPYVSKRLLTDKSDRTGGALSTFIFGPDKSDIENRIIDYDRVEQLITGFGDYTTSATGASLGSEKTVSDKVNDLADQILDLLASEEETPLQSIFTEQLAKIITSNTRSLWTEARERSGTLPGGRTVLGTIVDPLGLFRTSPIVRMNELDEKTVETTRNLVKLFQDNQQLTNTNESLDASSLSREELVELSTALVNKIWSRRSGILKTTSRLANQLLKLTADKLERGERETLFLSPVSDSDGHSVSEEIVNDGRLHDNTSKNKGSSDRLENAKRILASLEEKEKAETTNV
jgi:predicted unusual protein kinase regulating ubiquinone biosynthesis (AarF/ABC1/UbiB family)